MNILTELAIILMLCLLGNLFAYIIPFPIPSTIIALVLLFLLLKTRIIKLQWVENAGAMLIKYMPILFVPAGVKLMQDYSYIASIMIEVILISIVSTIIVFIVTAFSVKIVLKIKERF